MLKLKSLMILSCTQLLLTVNVVKLSKLSKPKLNQQLNSVQQSLRLDYIATCISTPPHQELSVLLLLLLPSYHSSDVTTAAPPSASTTSLGPELPQPIQWGRRSSTSSSTRSTMTMTTMMTTTMTMTNSSRTSSRPAPSVGLA